MKTLQTVMCAGRLFTTAAAPQMYLNTHTQKKHEKEITELQQRRKVEQEEEEGNASSVPRIPQH